MLRDLKLRNATAAVMTAVLLSAFVNAAPAHGEDTNLTLKVTMAPGPAVPPNGGRLTLYDVDASSANAWPAPSPDPEVCTRNGQTWLRDRFYACATYEWNGVQLSCDWTNPQSCVISGEVTFRTRILALGTNGSRTMRFIHWIDDVHTSGTGGSWPLTMSMGCRPTDPAVGDCHIASGGGRVINNLGSLVGAAPLAVYFDAVSDELVNPPAGDAEIKVWAAATAIYTVSGTRANADFEFPFRFDSYTERNDPQLVRGAVFPQAVPRLRFNIGDASFTQSAQHIFDALTSPDSTSPAWVGGNKHIPGAGNGPYDFLHYTSDPAVEALNRSTACPNGWWDDPAFLGIPDYSGLVGTTGKDCDEFPFATTREGAGLTGGTQYPEYSRRIIRRGDNRSAGSRYGQFHRYHRVLNGDEFAVQAYGGAPGSLAVIDVVGGGQFATVYATAGGSAVLGQPTDNWHSIDIGTAQTFQNGIIVWSPGTGTHAVTAENYRRYVSPDLGGPAGRLGLPTSDTSPTTDGLGRWNSFRSGGYIHWSPAFGAHATWGPIREKWTSLNWENGIMGYPVSDVQLLAPGEVGYFAGSKCGNGGPNGSGSAIYSSPSTGTHEMHGCIYDRYQQLGAAGLMGLPLSDEEDAAGGRVSYVQGSQCGAEHPYGSGGAIYASGTGTWRVNGCIYDKYLSVGGPGSAYGFPVGNETDLGASRWVSYLAGIHCRNGGPNGSGSAIYSSPATGTHTIQGCVYDRYWSQGGPDRVGLPLSDEQTLNGGWVSYVQGNQCGGTHPFGSGGAIYHASNGIGGRLNGCIYDKYIALGQTGGLLGFPASDEIQIDGGHWVTYFAGQRCTDTAPYQSGSAIYHSDAGSHEVHGCIYARYTYLGGPTGSGLGYPTSDEHQVNGAPQSDFQCGNIRWVNGSAQINRTCNQPGYFAPSEYVWDRNSTTCPGNDQFYTATDGAGAPIHWTYANGTNRCITVSYNPDTSASANCRFEFYVPNAHATGQIAFKFFYTEGDAPKTFTNWLDENPVTGWQNIGQASNVYRIEFTDANGQTRRPDGTTPELGWGADANHGIRRSC